MRKRSIFAGLAALVILISTTERTTIDYSPPVSKPIARVSIREPDVEKNYSLIEKYIQDFSKIYVVEMAKVSDDYKKHIENDKGIEIIAGKCANVELSLLDYAKAHLDETGIPASELEKMTNLSFKLTVENSICSKDHIDYNNKELVKEAKEAIADLITLRVEYFRRLLKAEGNSYYELVRYVYTIDEHRRIFEEMMVYAKRLSDAHEIGLNLVARLLFGSLSIDKIMAKNREIYEREEHTKIYSD